MTRADTAAASFSRGDSCSQAVAVAFAPLVGLDEREALRLASGFGGGMRIGGPCGAATGAVLIIGLALDGEDDTAGRTRVMAAVESFHARFLERVGAIDCLTILGCDHRTPEGRSFRDERGLRESICLPAVRAAAEILDEILSVDS